jgi:RHS repeat-associated protein
VDSVENPLRFPGQYRDHRSTYHENFMRSYSPSLGRYLELDPIGLRGGINAYAYALQNSVTRLDNLGLSSDSCCDRKKGGDALWINGEVGGGVGILFGGTAQAGVMVNSFTGETCFYTKTCAVYPTLGASAGASVGVDLVGPWCGKSMEGKEIKSCALVVDLSYFGGGGGNVGVSGSGCGGAGSASGGVGPSVGFAITIGIEVCTTKVRKCINAKCECE